MYFLYILECIGRCIVAMAGGTDKPLRTTGEVATRKDTWVGIAGWFVILIIIAAIRLFVYFKTKNDNK